MFQALDMPAHRSSRTSASRNNSFSTSTGASATSTTRGTAKARSYLRARLTQPARVARRGRATLTGRGRTDEAARSSGMPELLCSAKSEQPARSEHEEQNEDHEVAELLQPGADEKAGTGLDQ